MSGLSGGRIGITGHQTLTSATRRLVSAAIRRILEGQGELIGVTSLAAGSDQIFAQVVIELGGKIVVVLPAEQYERSFESSADLETYRYLLQLADSVVSMPFEEPSEDAYWAAGQRVVDEADSILAVWDGQPAGGLGGTADVVWYAREHGKDVTVIWPEGALRR